MTLRRVGDVQVVIVVYHTPAASHPDSGALQILANVLGATPAGRLHKSLVETKKAASVSGFQRSLREAGVAVFQTVVRTDSSIEEARSTLLGTIDGLATSPITNEELERARSELLRQIELGLKDSDALAFMVGGAAASGDWRLLFLRRDWIRNATPEDVRRVARNYFVPSNRTVATFIPDSAPLRAEIPAAPDVATLVKDYRGDVELAQGESFDPSPAAIDNRTIRTTTAGLKLALLPKKTRGATVNAVLRLNFGDESSLRGRRTEAESVPPMLMRGTMKHTRQQIQDDLNRLKARVSVSGGPGVVDVSIDTIRENLPEVIALVAEVLREPAFPESEFEELRQATLSRNESIRSEPQILAPLRLQRHLNPYPPADVRYVETPDEAIAETKALTLEGLKMFYKDFYGASNAELAVVGDFDADALQKQVVPLLSAWKSPRPYTRVARPYQKLSPTSETIETPDKANAAFAAGLPLSIDDEHVDYPALVLANYIIGGTSTSRLYVRIRAKDGLSYGVSSALVSQPKDRALFISTAICNPRNATKVEAAFREEMDRVVKEGFSREEIAAAKQGWLESQQVNRSQDFALARELRYQTHHGRTMAFQAVLEKKVAALTPEQVHSAARRYLDLHEMTTVKAGDFKKAGATP